MGLAFGAQGIWTSHGQRLGLSIDITGSMLGSFIFILSGVWDSLYLSKKDPFFLPRLMWAKIGRWVIASEDFLGTFANFEGSRFKLDVPWGSSFRGLGV